MIFRNSNLKEGKVTLTQKIHYKILMFISGSCCFQK